MCPTAGGEPTQARGPGSPPGPIAEPSPPIYTNAVEIVGILEAGMVTSSASGALDGERRGAATKDEGA
jgi:hypothetical protein